MAEALAKTGTTTWALTYAGDATSPTGPVNFMPFSALIYDLDIDVIADIFEATSDAGGRRLGKTGLCTGTITALGYMKVDSGYLLATTVVDEATTNTGYAITMTMHAGSGTNAGGTNAMVMYGVISRARVKASKTQGYVAVMLQFALCGTQT